MDQLRDNRPTDKRILIPVAVALLLISVLVGIPEASVEPQLRTSSSGSPDILLLRSPRPVEQLARSWNPDRVLEEVRQVVLNDSVHEVLSLYPNFLDPDEQVRLADLLLAEGARHDIDPLFLAALIRVESAFSKDAISNKGARGLMQLMPATGAEMAQQLGLTWSGPNGLHDPEYNLRLGTLYLRRLLDRYAGSYRRALTAYNRGPRNLRYIERRYGRLGARFTGYFRRIQQVYHQYQTHLGSAASLLQVG